MTPLLSAGQEQTPTPSPGPLARLINKADLYLHLSDKELKLRWSNAMILNNQQHSYVLSLLINISNSYLNNKLPFI